MLGPHLSCRPTESQSCPAQTWFCWAQCWSQPNLQSPERCPVPRARATTSCPPTCPTHWQVRSCPAGPKVSLANLKEREDSSFVQVRIRHVRCDEAGTSASKSGSGLGPESVNWSDTVWWQGQVHGDRAGLGEARKATCQSESPGFAQAAMHQEW